MMGINENEITKKKKIQQNGAIMIQDSDLK